MICVSEQLYENDPQREEPDPYFTPCGFCGNLTLEDEFCEVPTTKITLFCCVDCYDTVCDDEGVELI